MEAPKANDLYSQDSSHAYACGYLDRRQSWAMRKRYRPCAEWRMLSEVSIDLLFKSQEVRIQLAHPIDSRRCRPLLGDLVARLDATSSEPAPVTSFQQT